MMLPAKFAERVLRDLGDSEGAALCAALDTEPPVSVRLNPAKCGGPENGGAGREEDADKAAGRSDGVQPAVLADADGRVPWCGDGYYLAARPQFTFDSDFHAGAYYVQEAASQFVGHLLQGVEVAGRRILDLCAAPGGKTTLYASLAGPDGLVVANEIDRRRAQVLADNVRKWGTGNVAVTTCEARQLGGFEAWFDVVAVDAPCSGEGMFRKDRDARGEWSEGNVKLCAATQDELLREAWRALKPGGVLIYSTCTFNRDEDEGALERMLGWAEDEAAQAGEVAVDASWGDCLRTRGRVPDLPVLSPPGTRRRIFRRCGPQGFRCGRPLPHAQGEAHGLRFGGQSRGSRTAPLGEQPRTDVLRDGRRHPLRLLRRAGGSREGFGRSAPGDIFGRGDGAAFQGPPASRSRAGVLLRTEPGCGSRRGAGRRADAPLPAQAGDRGRTFC